MTSQNIPQAPAQPQQPPSHSQASDLSSGSNSTSSQNRRQHSTQISTIETSVTHLLVATKQLLEVLTQWSLKEANETAVSDVYVRLGYEFNIACRAFNKIGVDTADLGDVPELLRHILEKTLSQDASNASLETYLPRIRDIIISLLHGLKEKQLALRQRHGRRDIPSSGPSGVTRQGSLGNPPSLSALPHQTAQPSQDISSRPKRSTVGNSHHQDPQPSSDRHQTVPPIHLTGAASADNLQDAGSPHPSVGPSPAISGPSNAHAPYPSVNTIPTSGRDQTPAAHYFSQHSSPYQSTPPTSSYHSSNATSTYHPPSTAPSAPPSVGSQNSALLGLKSGGHLARRASRRMTLYVKDGSSGHAPSATNSPAPNRGRDPNAAAAARNSVMMHREESAQRLTGGYSSPPSISRDGIPLYTSDSPSANKALPPRPGNELTRNIKAERRSGMIAPNVLINGHKSPGRSDSTASPAQAARAESAGFAAQETKEMTVFLKYKRRVKKLVIEDRHTDLSLRRLELAFLDKFSWNALHPGVGLPAIYIEENGISYELEDIQDVKDNSVLVLNIDELDEVKQSINESLRGLQTVVDDVKTTLETQQATIKKVSEAQQTMSVELSTLASAPRPQSQASNTGAGGSVKVPSKGSASAQLREVLELKRDVSLLKQNCDTVMTEIGTTISTTKDTTNALKALVDKTDMTSYMQGEGTPDLWETSRFCEELMPEVEDLLTKLDILRDDVLKHRVRPKQSQLEFLSSTIAKLQSKVTQLNQRVEKQEQGKVWVNNWARVLEMIAREQKEAEYLKVVIVDFRDDLEDASALCEKIRNVANHYEAADRNMNPAFPAVKLRHVGASGVDDPAEVKKSVLDQLRAIEPDHARRLEAIQEAERMREEDLKVRESEQAFKKELTDFVENKFRPRGGVQQIETILEDKKREYFKDLFGQLGFEDGDDIGLDGELYDLDGVEGEMLDGAGLGTGAEGAEVPEVVVADAEAGADPGSRSRTVSPEGENSAHVPASGANSALGRSGSSGGNRPGSAVGERPGSGPEPEAVAALSFKAKGPPGPKPVRPTSEGTLSGTSTAGEDEEGQSDGAGPSGGDGSNGGASASPGAGDGAGPGPGPGATAKPAEPKAKVDSLDASDDVADYKLDLSFPSLMSPPGVGSGLGLDLNPKTVPNAE